MRILNYSDVISKDISEICKTEKVILDLKLHDIPNTMRRNVKTCAELGAIAVTVADHPFNIHGIKEAVKAGEEFGINIIIGAVYDKELAKTLLPNI